MSLSSSGDNPLNWRKSLRSIANGECVEVACDNQQVAVRDSKNPDGTWLSCSAESWRVFVLKLKSE